MSHAHSLNEDDIRNWVGEASFLRGQGYYRAADIHNARRCESETLARTVKRSEGNVYCPTATSRRQHHRRRLRLPRGRGRALQARGRAAADLACTLQITFAKWRALPQMLQALDRDHLIALIDDIAAHFSEIRGWLDLRLAADRAGDDAFSVRAFQHEIDLTLGNETNQQWYSSRPARAALVRLTAIAQRLRESGSVYAAAQAYGLIASGVIDNYYRCEDGGPIDVAVAWRGSGSA